MIHKLRKRYGEWAVVTGASSGIGLRFAEKLAAEGLNLVIAARRIELLNDLREKLIREHGVEVRCLQVDLSRNDCLNRLIEVCGDIEVGLVINNAGSGVPGVFSESDIEVEKDLIRLNCISPIEITHHFLPSMLARRKGAILFVSSLMGFQGVPYMANYSATKGYLLNFGESIYHECKDTGVDVLVVAPGATETPGKYLHEVDYSKLPISWMADEEVVDSALKSIGKKAFVIPGVRNHLTACLSGGLWSRGLVQGIMKRLARIALPLKEDGRTNPTSMADFELIQIGNGFEIGSSKGQTDVTLKVNWERVTEVNAFKRDLWSTDQICVAFTMDDGAIVEINEEMKGFTQLCEFLPEFLPSALPFGHWHQNIMVPAFEPCPTKIFSAGLTSKEDIS